MADVDVANYPFTTIDANRGVTHVRTECPCLDRDERCGNENCRDGKRYVPVELLDVAGLVPGAHEGKGLGNQFLDELTNADVVVNVVDASGATNAEGEPVEWGRARPPRRRGLHRGGDGPVARGDRRPQLGGRRATVALARLRSGGGGHRPADRVRRDRTRRDGSPPRAGVPRRSEGVDRRGPREALARAIRRRTKPIVVVANKVDAARRAWGAVDRLREGTDKPVVPVTAESSPCAAPAGVVDYDPGDEGFDVVGDISDGQREGLEAIRGAMAEYGGTGVQTALNAAVYDLLDRITVFPVQDASKWTDGRDGERPGRVPPPGGERPRRTWRTRSTPTSVRGTSTRSTRALHVGSVRVTS